MDDLFDMLAELGDPGDMYPAVCLTHKRFIPCRSNDGCVVSSNELDVQMIREYQYGDGN